MKAYKRLIMFDWDEGTHGFSPLEGTHWAPDPETRLPVLQLPIFALEWNASAGIYAVMEPDELQLKQYKGNLVELWLYGTVVEHEKGFRAQCARVTRVLDQQILTPDLVHSVLYLGMRSTWPDWTILQRLATQYDVMEKPAVRAGNYRGYIKGLFDSVQNIQEADSIMAMLLNGGERVHGYTYGVQLCYALGLYVKRFEVVHDGVMYFLEHLDLDDPRYRYDPLSIFDNLMSARAHHKIPDRLRALLRSFAVLRKDDNMMKSYIKLCGPDAEFAEALEARLTARISSQVHRLAKLTTQA